MFKICNALTLLFLFGSTAFSQTLKAKKVKILPVPAIGYSPETKTYVGAVTLFTFNLYNDSITRTSNAKLEVNYTWNKQLILECGWDYFFKEEKWFTKGQIHYSKYPDFYYGIGANTPNINKLLFNSNRFFFEGFVLKKIGSKLFTGLNARYINYTKVKSDADISNYPELVNGSTFGIGYSVLKDTRNNLLTPLNGSYIYFNTSYNTANKNYWKITLDVRFYKTWKDKFTIANRFINEFNSGTPPFYDFAFLGGDKLVRGYYYGRYRDNDLSSWQTEFRFPVIWKFGLATFGGLSNIYSSENSFKIADIKYNYGVGIRFLVDKTDKTNLRLDYAIGNNNNSGFYISFGESF
jgi:hypothetical protein